MELLNEKLIKLANSDAIIESDAGDVAGVDNKLGSKTEKRPKDAKDGDEKCPECGKEPCECETNESDEEVEPLKREEIEDILRDLSADELEFVKEIIKDNLEDFCPDFNTAFASAQDIETLVKIAHECCEEDLILLGDCVAFAMSELDDFSDFAYAGELGEISERLIDPQHIRRLRMQKRKAQWKLGAKKRARFRRTGAGRIMKRKAKLYMKKYRRRKKAKLKRYGKEMSKYNARMGTK